MARSRLRQNCCSDVCVHGRLNRPYAASPRPQPTRKCRCCQQYQSDFQNIFRISHHAHTVQAHGALLCAKNRPLRIPSGILHKLIPRKHSNVTARVFLAERQEDAGKRNAVSHSNILNSTTPKLHEDTTDDDKKKKKKEKKTKADQALTLTGPPRFQSVY